MLKHNRERKREIESVCVFEREKERGRERETIIGRLIKIKESREYL